MIKVIRMNNADLVVKTDPIQFIEPIPDTTISLATGKSVMLRDSVKRITTFKQQAGARPKGRAMAFKPTGVSNNVWR